MPFPCFLSPLVSAKLRKRREKATKRNTRGVKNLELKKALRRGLRQDYGKLKICQGKEEDWCRRRANILITTVMGFWRALHLCVCVCVRERERERDRDEAILE